MPYHVVKRGEKFCVEKVDGGKSLGCHPTQQAADQQLAAVYAHEPKHMRGLAGFAGTTRTENYQGRPHLVVPVVALVEGVVHAMNADADEFVSADEFMHTLKSWSGRPVFLGHPLVNGRPVSGNAPGILEFAVGRVFNPRIDGKRLLMEAWIDTEQADAFDLSLLNRVEGDEPIEVSIGAFVDTDDSTGEYGGKTYTGAWHNLLPDHLALLPEGITGACSREMGCGVRAAQKGSIMYEDWLEPGEDTTAMLRALRNIPMSVRDKMPAADFAGPNKSFPIQEPIDVHDAARAVGRAKGNPDAIKKQIIVIAYRKGESFVARLPEDWKKKKDQKAASAFARLMQAFRDTVMNGGEMSDSDVRTALREALAAKNAGMSLDVTDIYDTKVVYCVYGSDGMEYYERDFTMDATGTVTLGDATNVERVVSYEPVTAQDCGCHAKETDMTKQEITKYLETATEDQLKALSAVAQPPTTEELKAAADKKAVEDLKMATDKIAADKKIADDLKTAAVAAAFKTEADVLAAITDVNMKEAVAEGFKVGHAKKAASIKTLRDSKRCEMTDKELEAMTQGQLDNLVKLADLKVAAVDFSGQGEARKGDSDQAVAPPPDMNAKIRAAKAAKA